jgi:MFS family permease
MKQFTHITGFLGLQRSIVGLLSMVILVDMGERMGERFLPLYLIALGGGVLSVGLLNGMDNLLSALYAFPGGYLSDRLGVKRALFVFNLIAIAGFLLVAFVPTWPAVIAGAALFIAWSAISQPATVSLISRVLPASKRTMGVSMHSIIRRLPRAIGPLAGGLLIDRYGLHEGVHYAFLGAAAAGVVSLLLQQWLIEDTRPRQHHEAPTASPIHLLREMCPALRLLLVSDILVRFCEQIPYAFMIIWAMQTIAHPVNAFQFGLLTAIEMATAILVYIPVAHFADQGEKKPFVVVTFVFFTVFPLVLLFCQSFSLLVLAFILRGLKEFGEPTRKALIVDLCPEGNQAATFGAYYLARDLIVSIAAFGGAALWAISPATNLLAAFAFGVIGTVWYAVKGR